MNYISFPLMLTSCNEGPDFNNVTKYQNWYNSEYERNLINPKIYGNNH